MPILFERFICILKQFPLPLTRNLHLFHWFISSRISAGGCTAWTVQDSPYQKAGLSPSIITPPHTGCRVLLFHTFFPSPPSRTLWTQLPRPHSVPRALSVTSHPLPPCPSPTPSLLPGVSSSASPRLYVFTVLFYTFLTFHSESVIPCIDL